MSFSLAQSVSQWFSSYFNALVDRLIEEIKIGDIGEGISESIMQVEQYFSVGSTRVLLTDAVIAIWIAMIPSIFFWIWMASRRDRVPKGRQIVPEAIVGLLTDLCMNNGMNRKQAAEVTPMVGTIAFFLLSCNVVSMLGVRPPAKNIAFPVSMAFFAIIYVIFISIRFVGVKGFFRSLVYPMKAMLPFRILEYIIKPMSLSLRLFGNIFGAFILMEFIRIVVPVILPGVLLLWFDIA
ncbi:MAG: F0F1 ATP synthase subunit A, partial [Clostridiales bacterium]|nr:F0F1 ATP synthase subunit A [Clostridiales bacterium]